MNPDTLNDDVANNEMGDDELLLPETKTKNGGNRFVFPNGDYEFVCVEVVDDVSTSGNPMLVWTFRGPDELNNGSFKTWTVRTPDAAWKITEYAEALGIAKAGESLKISVLKKKAIGRRVIGELKEETYNGNTRSVIKRLKAHPQGPGEGRADSLSTV